MRSTSQHSQFVGAPVALGGGDDDGDDSDDSEGDEDSDDNDDNDDDDDGDETNGDANDDDAAIECDRRACRVPTLAPATETGVARAGSDDDDDEGPAAPHTRLSV